MTEISEADLQAITKLSEAATRAGLQGAAGQANTAKGSLFTTIGATDDTPITSIGIIPEDDWKATVRGWKVQQTDAHGAVTERPPTLTETGQALYLGRIARMKLGLDGASSPQSTAVSAVPAVSSTAIRKIKMSQILSQLDESEVELVSSAEQLKCFARYEVLFGKNQRPHPDHEPSIEQLSGLKALLDATQPPYADYAIFQPYAARIMKKIKFSGLILNKAGALAQAEIFGPPDLDNWRSCHEVWSNAMIMLDAIDLGALQAYKSRIEMLHVRYGESKVWPLLYQADTRARLEHLPRKRLELLQAHQEAVRAGNTTPYNENRPWNYALSCVANDDRFWSHEFIEPAMIILSDGKGVKTAVEDDAKVAPHSDKQAALMASAPSTVRPRNSNRTGRVHDLVDGSYRSNRTGHQLCTDYNSGKCTNTVQGTWCGSHPNRAHQCSRCLGTHPLTSCPHQEAPQPSWIRNSANKPKGRGRGNGKGRGRSHKGSAPYWQLVQEPEVSPQSLAEPAEDCQAAESTDFELHDNGKDSFVSLPTIQADVQKRKRKLLYLFSGSPREDSIGYFLSTMNWDCEDIDIEAHDASDLLDVDVWDALWSRVVAGEFDAGFASPPCCTFSTARTGDTDGGPRQLRGPMLPELNGLRNLTESEKHEVKAGNVLADRAAECMKWFADRHDPWGVEQPARREGKPSMFNLEKFQQLAAYEGVSFTKFSQCRFGAKFNKATEILGNLDLENWPRECNHPSRTWVIPWSGVKHYGPHPPLKGRQMAIPIEQWDKRMLRKFEPYGPFLTKEIAHYTQGHLTKQ